jgi:opacity protein-like surface antigen
MYKRIGLTGLAVLSLMAGAAAQADTQPGFYAGVGIGSGTIEVDEVDFDESDTAFKIFGGYQFNENFAVELTYLDGGAPEMTVSGPGVTGSVEAEVTGLNAAVLGRIPLASTFAIFGKIGLTSYDVEATGRVNNQVIVSGSDSSEEITYGVGGAFSFGPSFEMRAEYEMADINDGDYSLLSVSGLFRF